VSSSLSARSFSRKTAIWRDNKLANSDLAVSIKSFGRATAAALLLSLVFCRRGWNLKLAISFAIDDPIAGRCGTDESDAVGSGGGGSRGGTGLAAPSFALGGGSSAAELLLSLGRQHKVTRLLDELLDDVRVGELLLSDADRAIVLSPAGILVEPVQQSLVLLLLVLLSPAVHVRRLRLLELALVLGLELGTHRIALELELAPYRFFLIRLSLSLLVLLLLFSSSTCFHLLQQASVLLERLLQQQLLCSLPLELILLVVAHSALLLLQETGLGRCHRTSR